MTVHPDRHASLTRHRRRFGSGIEIGDPFVVPELGHAEPHPSLHGSCRKSEPCSDLHVGQASKVGQGDHLSLQWRQVPDHLSQALGVLGRDDVVLEHSRRQAWRPVRGRWSWRRGGSRSARGRVPAAALWRGSRPAPSPASSDRCRGYARPRRIPPEPHPPRGRPSRSGRPASPSGHGGRKAPGTRWRRLVGAGT